MIAVPLSRALAALALFGISFGFIEASVVVYLRALSVPFRQAAGLPPGEIFPLLNIAQLQAMPVLVSILKTELAREFATMLLLWSMALALGRTPAARFAVFLIAFGIWDIAFYLSLKALIAWPESLFTPDLLFLLPVPWWGPVWSPVVASIVMITGGIAYLRRPCRMQLVHWIGIFLGGLVMVIAFTWDYRLLMAGGIPTTFQWPIYWAGLALCGSSFLFCHRYRPIARS